MSGENPNRPVLAVPVPERETCVLTMASGEEREMFVRGGICWPVLRPGAQAVEGFVLVGAVDCETGRAFVFEALPFHTIEPMTDAITRRISSAGIGLPLGIAWRHYAARRFFYNQIDEFNDMNMGLVHRSKTILPTPQMVRVDWSDEDEPRARMIQWAARMVLPAGGALQEQFAQFMAQPAGALLHYPAVQALACLQAGLERWPWRKAGVPRRFGP